MQFSCPRVWFQHVKYDSYSHECDFDRYESVSERKLRLMDTQVWIYDAELDFYTHYFNFHLHGCDIDTHEFEF
jgi:hypothetical protein